MDDFYKEMQGIATGLLREFNQGKIEYVAMIPGSGPVDDPGPATPVTFGLQGVARGVQQRYVDNTHIVATDMQVTVSTEMQATDITFDNGALWDNLAMWSDPVSPPKITGFIRVDGVKHKIIRVVRIPAAGTPVAYVIVFRR
jgi:hypothetical protein